MAIQIDMGLKYIKNSTYRKTSLTQPIECYVGV